MLGLSSVPVRESRDEMLWLITSMLPYRIDGIHELRIVTMYLVRADTD